MRSNLKRIKELSQAAAIVSPQPRPVDQKLTEMTEAILQSPDRDRILQWLAQQ